MSSIPSLDKKARFSIKSIRDNLGTALAVDPEEEEQAKQWAIPIIKWLVFISMIVFFGSAVLYSWYVAKSTPTPQVVRYADVLEK